jgi:DNA-binding LytR/AlgR family response regulator
MSFLCRTISSSYPKWNIDCANNRSAAIDYINNSIHNSQLYTLFLLDVQLSKETDDRSGFFIAEKIRNCPDYYKIPILFLTVISDESYFALSNFHCYNYIKKPYSSEEILYQLEQMLITGYLEDNITITDTSRVCHNIRKKDILYIESQSHVLKIYTSNGAILTREYSMNTFSNYIGNTFLRCHKRYIVNKKHIKNYDKQLMLFQIDNANIPIGKSYIPYINFY